VEVFSNTLRAVDTRTHTRQWAMNRERKQAARYKEVWASEGIVPLILKLGYWIENCRFMSTLCFLREGNYRGADKSLVRPTSRYILFDGENISFDASLVIYIYIFIYIYD